MVLAKKMKFILLDLFCKVFYTKTKKVDLPALKVLVLKNKDNAQKHDNIIYDCPHSEHFKHFEYLNSINPRL